MEKLPKIRVIVLGLIRSRDRIFVSQFQDPVKQDTLYRSLGGGVEFGEHSCDALHREFQEEIQAELTNIQYLACLENIFIFNGQAGHELIQLYQCDFVDSRFYELESLDFVDGNLKCTALWMPVDRFRSGELRLVPESFLDYYEG
ncbi:NUDIX domain-containing protein [Microcoleus sp. bin38.metabat.b11b12b14.051]|uniref:NUDIX hydrolase n=1 Tax=Microcoleus sp. bin38.metabat.b11b12b14.051 TaxID=2742709 RepID=UPI0025D733E6|nr:NUDIX domain-containing protein [Microcoleus sp. bin38.metabat.b11b12b14.051]